MSLVAEQPKLDRMGIIVDGRRFEEWSEGRVSADIFTPANSFSLRCGPMGLDIIQRVLPGRGISIYIGDGTDDTILLTGWTEGFMDSTSKRDWGTNVTGRDMASDLVENSVPEDLSVKGKSFYDIAQEVCDTVGISVICTNEANRLAVTQKKKFKKEMAKYGQSLDAYNAKVANTMKPWGPELQYSMSEGAAKAALKKAGVTQPMKPPLVKGIFNTNDEAEPQDGESCWDFLSRYCKALEVFMWMTAGGVLVCQRPRYDQDPQYVFLSRIDRPENNNVISRTVNIDIASIPTSYKRIGRYKGKGEKRERITAEYDATRVIPTSDDPIMATSQGEQDTDLVRVASAFSRARWEMDTEAVNLNDLGNRAWYALKAMEMGFMTIELTLDGWDQGGIPYAPDTVGRLVDEKLGLDGSYYIASCDYLLNDRQSGGGRKTRATLTPLYVWSPAA